MVDVRTLKAGDKLRRINKEGFDVDIGEVVTLKEMGHGGLTIDGKATGLAMPEYWEHVKSEEEPTLTNATELLTKLEALTAEVAKLVAQEKASKPSGRHAVIAKAKADLETIRRQRESGGYTEIEYHVNARKGTVVALRKSVGGNVLHVGRATVSRDDKFDEHIGKAIAALRALGKPVPKEYLDAPQR